MQFDVFNGDADGICALIQLRLAAPCEARLVTGVKREINLLERVTAQTGDKVLVLDVSMQKNLQALKRLLEQGVEVLYFDHHQAPEIPQHPALTAVIETAADVCTSLLVDHYLQHRFSEWAVTAAFGDNLMQSATNLAKRLHLSSSQTQTLCELGRYINYNAYGATVADLHIPPEQLYRCLYRYESPFAFVAQETVMFQQLQAGYLEDLQVARQTPPLHQSDKIAVFLLPDAAWARRVNGAWSNELASQHPERAHAVLIPHAAGGYSVSVRAPLTRKTGADSLCAAFATGGGRQAAAGINQLAADELNTFIAAFARQYDDAIPG